MDATEHMMSVFRKWTPDGVNDATLQVLVQYVQLLLKWNRRINLVGTRNADTLFARHVVDSIQAASRLNHGPQLVDVGSGAGLPGLVTAICRPDLQITLVERRGKKSAFLVEATRVLGLANVDVRSADATRIALSGSPRFDQAISRATYPPDTWFDLARQMIIPRGTIWFMLGPRQRLDFLDSQPEFRIVRRFEYELPESGVRRLVGVSAYPDAAGQQPT